MTAIKLSERLELEPNMKAPSHRGELGINAARTPLQMLALMLIASQVQARTGCSSLVRLQAGKPILNCSEAL